MPGAKLNFFSETFFFSSFSKQNKEMDQEYRSYLGQFIYMEQKVNIV